MEILYLDNKIIVCVKPVGVLSADEPGGMPSLLRAALGDDAAPVYAVHRLDAAVSGVMVYARTRHAAADLGRAIERGDVRKEYLAVACGALPEQRGELLLALFDYAERTAKQPLSPETALDSYPALDGQTRMAFRFMANSIERDTKKWERQRERRSQGAAQRYARARGEAEAPAPSAAGRNDWMKDYTL